jgi:hypothetical protein
MTTVTYRPAALEDVLDVAPRLREQDRIEVCAATGKSPMEAVSGSFQRSKRTWAAVIGGRPECLFGIGELDHRHGVPWMVGTPALLRHQRRLLVDARSVVEDMQAAYRVLYNITHARNYVSIRWLYRLGFEFGKPFYLNNEPFIPFYRHRHVS